MIQQGQPEHFEVFESVFHTPLDECGSARTVSLSAERTRTPSHDESVTLTLFSNDITHCPFTQFRSSVHRPLRLTTFELRGNLATGELTAGGTMTELVSGRDVPVVVSLTFSATDQVDSGKTFLWREGTASGSVVIDGAEYAPATSFAAYAYRNQQGGASTQG